MNVLDLFSGTGGWSDPWVEAGHDVRRVELEDKYDAAYHTDAGDVAHVLSLLGGWKPDVIFASPPCNSFSTMSMGKMWTHEGEPKHPTAVEGQRLVQATLRYIVELNPKWFVIENPRARLRSLPLLQGITRTNVWYCRFGEERAKPTDLWHRLPRELHLQLADPKYVCQNGNPDHIAAPRGSTTGTQGGFTREESYRIPQQLSRMVMEGLVSANEPEPWT